MIIGGDQKLAVILSDDDTGTALVTPRSAEWNYVRRTC